MRNVSEIQRELIRLGFMAEGQDDGKFGPISMDAYNHFLASKGKPPHEGLILLTELNAELFPQDVPPPKPKKPSLFETLALNAILNKLKDSKMLAMLPGMKSYLTGFAMIIVGALSLLAPIVGLANVPGLSFLSAGEAFQLLTTGLGIVFLRKAIAS